MVSLKDVQLSNSHIASSLPPHLVAVFVGSTSGIGEHSLKTFAKYANKPRIYFVGRSQESADRILAELKGLNADGEYNFIKADVSSIQTVDEVCQDIKNKEKSINLLFLCPGAMHMHRMSLSPNFRPIFAHDYPFLVSDQDTSTQKPQKASISPLR
jgi:NAD(P)-dependent dehydrogenase (short-subunit alcohol dehydrogenase family)